MLDHDLKKELLAAQKNEITEYMVYLRLARLVKNRSHAEVLEKVAREERAHYEYFKTATGVDVAPNQGGVLFYELVSRIFGLNFGLRLMERGEHLAGDAYARIKESVPQMGRIMKDEKDHERALLDMIDEDRLKYISSVILGLNDALVELTAMLAGFTLALQNTSLIGILGVITGIAAALSMAVSEYLATKHEEADKDPLKASLYTGVSYIAAVTALVLPYFFLTNIFLCLAIAIGLALLAIAGFTFYISVAQKLN